MTFRETLENICNKAGGALAAGVMGFDGIAVELLEQAQTEGAEVNLNSAMIEYSNIFAQLRTAAEHLQAGEASEITLRTERLVGVARIVSPDYFVALALDPNANVGKARYALRVSAGKLAEELGV